MSQSDFGTIDPNSKSGDALSADLNNWRTAVHSTHKGSTEPTYKTAGILWLDDTGTPWILKMYDGTSWIPCWAINATTNVAYPISSTSQLNYPSAGGTANALTLTPAPPIAAYTDLDMASFEATASNTGAATINISGVGAKAIRKIVGGTDVALVANDILVAQRYLVNYDAAANAAAGAWILINPSGAYATLTGAETLSNKTLVTPKVQDATVTFTYSVLGSALAANRVITLPALTANDEFVFKGWNIQSTSFWQAGTGTVESLVTPAKIKAAILALVPPVVPPSYQVWTTSGTWFAPAGFSSNAMVTIYAVGGGGGGGSSGRARGGGGGGGAGAIKQFALGNLGASQTVTVGAAGLTSAVALPTAGGASSFGGFLIAYGGGPGMGTYVDNNNGGGGGSMRSAGANITSGAGDGGFGGLYAGTSGGDGVVGGGGGTGGQASVTPSPGGNSIWGGGGGGGKGGAFGGGGSNGLGGYSQFAGDGGASMGAGGNFPGGGGGYQSNGAAGQVIIWISN